MSDNSQSETDTDAGMGMAPRVARKPTLEYDGYSRTITEVIRVRQSEDPAEIDNPEVNELLRGLDGAIKDCRALRRRLERLHRKRNTGYYSKLNPKEG